MGAARRLRARPAASRGPGRGGRRELAEETGQRARAGSTSSSSASYGAPGRDPRMRVVSVAYLAFAPDLPDPQAGSDARAAAWVPVERSA